MISKNRKMLAVLFGVACSVAPLVGCNAIPEASDTPNITSGAEAETTTTVVEDDMPEAEPESETSPPSMPEETETSVDSSPSDQAGDVPILIYDTDMGPDVDDAVGLGIAHAYETKGLIKLGAVVTSRNNDYAARYSDIVNTYYGRPDIPIGKTSTVVPEQNDNNYWTSDKAILDKYPHDVHESDIPEGYKVMRKVLAEAPDQSVIIAHVGFTTNVDQLLLSEADEFSDLNGVDLVKKKVKSMAIMGGENIGEVKGGFNFTKYAPGTPVVFDNWPVPILQSEGPLGENIHFPGSAIQGETDNPVADAYNASIGKMDWHPSPNMKSWDPLTVMGAVEPELFNLGPEGEIVLIGDKRAHTDFEEKSGGIDRSMGHASDYSDAEKDKVISRMVELATTPKP